MSLYVVSLEFGIEKNSLENFLISDFSFIVFVFVKMASSFSSPWPDPNSPTLSPTLSKIDFGVPLVDLLKWLDVRDTLLGDNFRNQDITSALALARDCKHPDAEWLTSILKDVSTEEHVREVFLLHQSDARALCFAGWFNGDPEAALLRRAAKMGNAFACSFLCEQLYEDGNEVVEEEFFRLAQFAASLYERDGFRWLGCCFEEGIGCEEPGETKLLDCC